MKRNYIYTDYNPIEVPRIDKFLNELADLYLRHGMQIEPYDPHESGALYIDICSADQAERVRNADDLIVYFDVYDPIVLPPLPHPSTATAALVRE